MPISLTFKLTFYRYSVPSSTIVDGTQSESSLGTAAAQKPLFPEISEKITILVIQLIQ